MTTTIKIDNIRELMLHTMIKTLTSPTISYKTLFDWNDDDLIDNRLLDNRFINKLEETEDDEEDMMIDINDDFDNVFKKLFLILGLPKENEIKLTNQINNIIFYNFQYVLRHTFDKIALTTLQIAKSHGNVAFKDKLEDICMYKTTFFNTITLEEEPLRFDDDHIVIKINDDSQDRNKAKYLCLEKNQVRMQMINNKSAIKYPCYNNLKYRNPHKDYSIYNKLFSLSSISDMDILISFDSLDRIIDINPRNHASRMFHSSKYYFVAVKIFVDIPSLISKSVAEMKGENGGDEIEGGYHCQGGIGHKFIYTLLPVEYTPQTLSKHSAATRLNLRQRSQKRTTAPKKPTKKSTKK